MPPAPASLPAPRRWLLFALIAVPAAMLRAHLFYTGRLPFDSDQAIAGIGALRLLAGGEHRVYLPGQNFNGEILTYWFLPWHAVFVASPALMRLGMLPWTVGLWIAMWQAARRLLRSEVGALAVLLVAAFPAPMVLDWTMHSASNYIVVLLALSLCCPPLVTMVERQRLIGWRRGDPLRTVAIGLLMGVAFWAHFSALVAMVALAAALLLCPRALAAMLGLSDVWERRDQMLTWPLAMALAASQIILLLTATHALLIRGDIPSGAFVAAAAVLLTLAAGETRAWGGGLTRLPPWGVALAFIGLWLGAFPVLIHNASSGTENFFAESQSVEDLELFWEQLGSVFTRGLPVLMGMRDDHAAVPAGVPLVVRGLPPLLGLGALIAAAARLVRLRRRPDEERFGPALIVTTAVSQALLFAASNRGWLIDNPRYIFLLWWAVALAIGLAAGWLWERRRLAALIALAALVVNGLATNLARERREIVNLRGLEQPDAALFRLLAREGITRVSCRFAGRHAYWLAWRLSYIAGGEILFAHQRRPGGSEIRAPHWQRAVEEADDPALLIHHVDEFRLFEAWLDVQGFESEWASAYPMRLHWNVDPEIRRLTMRHFQAFIDEQPQP